MLLPEGKGGLGVECHLREGGFDKLNHRAYREAAAR
jgi:hypothetical protein